MSGGLLYIGLASVSFFFVRDSIYEYLERKTYFHSITQGTALQSMMNAKLAQQRITHSMRTIYSCLLLRLWLKAYPSLISKGQHFSNEKRYATIDSGQ